jgi:uncharacterized protein YjbJ (UPF0337 family)
MNTDKKAEQDVQELKGHIEETAGKVFGDDGLVAHGRTDQIAAHAKQAANQAAEAARHIGRNVKERAMDKLGELHERLHEAADDAARDRPASEREAGADQGGHPDS